MRDTGEEYLTMYPKLRKWINECIVCHAKGYKLNIPQEINPNHPTAATKTIRAYLNHWN